MTRPPLTRAETMARVKGRDTGPELLVRRALWAAGLRYRLQAADLPGRPDLVFRGRRVALFVHGCFWHQHGNCRAGRMPTAHRDFWTAKLTRNTDRDAETKRALQQLGWRVLTVWECETKHPEKLQRRLARLLPLAAPEK